MIRKLTIHKSIYSMVRGRHCALSKEKKLVFLHQKAAHLDDSGPAHVLGGRGAIQHAVAMRRPLDVAQPAGPVGVPLQVGVEGDGVVASVTCKADSHNCDGCREGWGWVGLGGTRAKSGTFWRFIPALGYGGNSPLKCSLSRTWTKSTPADG